jgi:hypothetical protein
MKTILYTLVALSVLAGVATSASADYRRDWEQHYGFHGSQG